MTQPRILESPEARKVLHLVVNNDMDSALSLCHAHKDDEISMAAKLSYIAFVKAVVAFDKDLCSSALDALADTERLCGEIERAGTPDGLVGVVGNWMLWRSSVKRAKPLTPNELTTLGLLKGDCNLFMAILSMVGMDIAGFVKGGWLIRKAYKHYERCYDDAVRSKGMAQSKAMPELSRTKPIESSADPTIANPDLLVDDSDVLLGNASFGFGLFNLLVSLLSPQVLRLIQFLGFGGDREVGLRCLRTCAATPCSKRPLAILVLLNYHCTVRPFLNLDPGDIVGGVPEARSLLERFGSAFSDSSFFHLFRGRLERLEGRLDEAIRVYTEAGEKPGSWREVKGLCDYEKAWCHLLARRFDVAAELFDKQKHMTKWSKSFFAYLEGLCVGAGTGEVTATGSATGAKAEEASSEVDRRERCLFLLKSVVELSQQKKNQVEDFVLHRAKLVADSINLPQLRLHDVCSLFALECVYLWNAMPSIGADQADAFSSSLDRIAGSSFAENLCLLMKAALMNSRRKREGCGVWDSASAGVDELLELFGSSAEKSGKMKSELHIAASALYEKALLLMENEKNMKTTASSTSSPREEAAKLLNQVKFEFGGCDLENRISMKAHAALQKYGL